MSQLFLHFYLDEDVSLLVADLLRSRGCDVTTTLEARKLGQSDDEQLQFAAQHGMTIVTHNRKHFDRLAGEYVTAGRSHTGIVIAVQRSEPQIAERLLAITDRFSRDEMRDQVLYI